jgi:hypothetical protein
MLRRLTAELTEPTDVIRAMLTGVDRAAARDVDALADSQTSGR